MKKKQLLRISVLLTLSMLLAYACQNDEEDPMESTLSTEILAPTQLISANSAKDLFTNYKTNRITLIKKHETEVNKAADFTPTQYVEWDIETMEQYLAYIKQEAENADIKIETLRFYMGQYGSKSDAKETNHNTLFMLPTTEINGKNTGFYIDSSGKATAIRSKTSNTGKNNGASLIMNNGHGGPPPTGDFGG